MTDASFPTAPSKEALERGEILAPRFDANGLMPVITTHAHSGEVLMLGYMNAQALALTLELGEVVYFSRSRNEIWHKGATSGQIQKIVEMRVDCDQDCILVKVLPQGDGGACHVGFPSCFYRVIEDGKLVERPLSPAEALVSFTGVAVVMAMVPGLDTALILRAAAVEGPRRAGLAAVGVMLGCLAWGLSVAVGLGALLAASQTAFTALKWAGAAYLLWLGIGLLLRPRASFDLGAASPAPRGGDLTWMRRGFVTNILNPKVGVFYVSFLPQFLADGVAPGPFLFLLALIHAVLGLAWFALLIGATRPLARTLKRPAVVARLDRITGGIFVAFAARLALEKA